MPKPERPACPGVFLPEIGAWTELASMLHR